MTGRGASEVEHEATDPPDPATPPGPAPRPGAGAGGPLPVDAILARLVADGLAAEERPVARRLVRRFHADFGAWPDLSPPRRYVEWILHRLIFDRDPRLAILVDKVAVRAHVRGVLGHDPMLPLLQVHARAEDLDWDALPPAVMLKASHGSGWNIPVRRKAAADRAAVVARLSGWLGGNLWRDRTEWAYRDVPPRIIAEPLLVEPGCARPGEICIYCFGGVPQYIRVNRFGAGGQKGSGCFDTALRPLGLYAEAMTEPFPAAIDAAALLETARRLSAGFVYLRVDFMVARGHAWLGELTLYPGGGRSTNFRDDAAELLLGGLYAAAQRGDAQPFMLDGRTHFTAPPAAPA